MLTPSQALPLALLARLLTTYTKGSMHQAPRQVGCTSGKQGMHQGNACLTFFMVLEAKPLASRKPMNLPTLSGSMMCSMDGVRSNHNAQQPTKWPITFNLQAIIVGGIS